MDKEFCLKLISLYGVNTWLWNASDPNYTNRGLREDAWLNISREMNMPVPDLKKKMESLMGSYQREKSREKKSRLTGSGRDDVYKSSWFSYNAFAFMSDRNEPGTTRDTIDNKETDTNDETVSATQLAQDPSPNKDNIQVIENQQLQQDDTNNTQSRVRTQDQRSRKRSKKRPAKDTDDSSDQTLSEAFRILQQCAEPQPTPQPPCDSYSAFGQYIANELRKYDPVTLAHVKKDICGIIFQADTGAYQQYGYYTQSYVSSYTDPTSPLTLPPQPPISPRPSTHTSSYTDPTSPSPLPPQPPISLRPSIHTSSYTDPTSPSPLPPQPPISPRPSIHTSSYTDPTSPSPLPPQPPISPRPSIHTSSYTDPTSSSPLPPQPPITPHPGIHVSSHTDPMPPSPLPSQPSSTPFPMTSPIQSKIPLPPSPTKTSQNPSEIPPLPLAPKYTKT